MNNKIKLLNWKDKLKYFKYRVVYPQSIADLHFKIDKQLKNKDIYYRFLNLSILYQKMSMGYKMRVSHGFTDEINLVNHYEELYLFYRNKSIEVKTIKK